MFKVSPSLTVIALESISKLNNSGELMQETKKQYEEQAVLISNSKYYMQTEKYKLEFLWTRIGNYAKDNGVTPKMYVTSGSTKGVYNLIIYKQKFVKSC